MSKRAVCGRDRRFVPACRHFGFSGLDLLNAGHWRDEVMDRLANGPATHLAHRTR